MDAEKIQEIWNSADWQRCVDFHGHECPGLAIGFMAAKAGLASIRGDRSEDEEIVAVVENDACGVDAVQVLTGSTFGKGNLIHLDHGKQVFTFFNRNRNQGVRFSLRADASTVDDRYRELTMLFLDGRASPQELSELGKRRVKVMRDILSKSAEELFVISEPNISLPGKAVMQRSEACAVCGEPTMPRKMVDMDDRRLCRPCAAAMTS